MNEVHQCVGHEEELNKSVLILDIDKYLVLIEEQYSQYLPAPQVGIYKQGIRSKVNLDNVKYYVRPNNIEVDYITLPTERGQYITDSDGNIVVNNFEVTHQLASFKPIHAQSLITVIEDIFYKIIYESNPLRGLYYNDNLNLSNHIPLMPLWIPSYSYTEDIILKHFKGIPEIEVKMLIGKLSNIFINDLIKFINTHPTYTYSIDTTTADIRITRNKDIRAVRYELARDIISNNKDPDPYIGM
jgi:hypothetical protein